MGKGHEGVAAADAVPKDGHNLADGKAGQTGFPKGDPGKDGWSLIKHPTARSEGPLYRGGE